MENNLVGFFNLPVKDSMATVRLLHTSVSTIEHETIHLTPVGDKKRNIRCVGNGCPLCAQNVMSNNRVFIHLWDYTDNCEKVWSRTDKILPQLQEIENAWGDLSNVVLNIKRESDQFPTYAVSVMPPNFPQVDRNLVDQKIAYRFYLTRSKEELEEFVRTGVLPEHKKKEFVPKQQYFAQQNNQQYSNPFPQKQQSVPQYQPQQYQPQSYTGTPQYAPQTATPVEHPVTNPFGNQPQQGYVDPFANLINRKV